VRVRHGVSICRARTKRRTGRANAALEPTHRT
jgi:hypothetical protein